MNQTDLQGETERALRAAAESLLVVIGDTDTDEQFVEKAIPVLLPLFNAGIAGAYAAAAKLCDELARNGKGLFEASEALYKLSALTPADAQNTQTELTRAHYLAGYDAGAVSTTERMACGHLKADEITICDDMGCIQNSHQREYNLDCRCGGRWVTKCGICAAIASAEARARLEAVDICNAATKRFPHCTIELREAARLIAAARTPDSTKEPE